ncbi:hypothetical protein [Candidatus Palauibacter sp.]|uniref:hypothetical protein n=1 Tax=Candidatus Palauibacter sp. TaxID=3101350 RepID=UPI003B014D22
MPAETRPIEPPHYPIIYVRGYAATMREIEETVGTPYMGFSLGSRKVRQGHADDRPVRFIFESPLIRLMKDEDYIDAYRDGDFVSMGRRVDSRSVWIFRYYEQDSKSFGDGEKDTIKSYAEDLRKFILRVRERVCLGHPEELKKFKVYLVAHSMGGLIFFCFVGTNYRDYGAFLGLSKRGTGPSSDGLVMMKNAWVDGAPCAFAHRSHSGPFGIVNSEEGYQNLRRFLFGQVRIDALLAVDEITLPRAVEKKKDEGKKIRARYNIDACAKVRGGGCYLSERRVRNESAIRKRYEDLVEEKKPAYLFSGFLLESAKTSTKDTALAFAIEIAIEVPVFDVEEKFWFDEHFEGETLLNETVTLHLRWRDGGKTTVRYGLRTRLGSGHATKRVALAEPDGQSRVRVEIPLGFKKGLKNPPRPGFRGRLLLMASPWNT